MTAADDRKVTTAPDVSVHKPFTDDGVTYCGWYAGPGTRVVDGCGQVWPCETVQARRKGTAWDLLGADPSAKRIPAATLLDDLVRTREIALAAAEARGVDRGRTQAAEATAVTAAPVIGREWMAHLGYTADEIGEGEADRDHAACDTENGVWFCTDEYGKSRHPYQDEMDSIAALVMFVLEHPATDGGGYGRAIAQLRDGKAWAQWARANDGALYDHDTEMAAEYLEAVEGDR